MSKQKINKIAGWITLMFLVLILLVVSVGKSQADVKTPVLSITPAKSSVTSGSPLLMSIIIAHPLTTPEILTILADAFYTIPPDTALITVSASADIALNRPIPIPGIKLTSPSRVSAITIDGAAGSIDKTGYIAIGKTLTEGQKITIGYTIK